MPSTLIWRIITDAHEGAKARAPADASRRAVGRRFAGHWQDDYRGRRSDRDQPADAEHDCQWSRPGDARRGGVARLGNGPGLWLRLQADWDAEHIDPAIRAKVERIRTLEALNGVRECYLRMLDMAQENMVAGLDLARELGSVKTPMEFVEVWNAGTREAYGTFSEQTKELSELAQKV